MKNLISKNEKDRIDLFCRENLIRDVVVNSLGTVDVNDNVNLYKKDLFDFTIQFGKIRGDFKVSFNSLTSCNGFPIEVHGKFSCAYNIITSLIGGPQIVLGDYQCNNNLLKSLEGLPATINGDLVCVNNKLVNLNAIGVVTGGIMCNNNHLTTLIGLPSKIDGDLVCSGNTFESLLGAPEYIKGNFICHSQFLKSTYSGDIDIEVNGNIIIASIFLPEQLRRNIIHIRIILKYQRHFEIWNNDLSLNEHNFDELISEINDGLQ